MTSQINARALTALKAAWIGAALVQETYSDASSAFSNNVKAVAGEVIKLAVKLGVNGADATDLFLDNVRVALRNAREMSDSAFRKMWSRVKKSAYVQKGTPLVISAKVKAESARARANILKGFAANYTFDKAAVQALIKKHMEDEVFLVNAGKLIEQISGGKEVFRIAKIVKAKPDAKAETNAKAKPTAKVVGKIAPVVKATRAKKAA